MQVEVHRGTGEPARFEQEIVLDAPELKITAHVLAPGTGPIEIGAGAALRPGSLLVWYLWPGRRYEIGAFHDPRGAFLGHYVNLIRPPLFGAATCRIEDLALDIWAPMGGEPVLLDEEDLVERRRTGWISNEEETGARALAEALMARIREGEFPPPEIRRWPPELIPALRLRRDRPGTFHAAKLSGRIIAYGLYLMGAVSTTSIGFAASSDAFIVAGPAQTAWKWTVAGEALVLLPLALGGRLPATRWPRPALTDERSLFIATLASGLAVLALNERAAWATALLPVYGTLGLFSTIFAVFRARYDRVFPAFAVAGLLVTLAALWILL